jgi:hypothetical protein
MNYDPSVPPELIQVDGRAAIDLNEFRAIAGASTLGTVTVARTV